MTKYLAFVVLLVPALWACGDNTLPGSESPDASADSLHVVVVSGNFKAGEVGVMSTLDLATMQVTERVAPNGAVAEDPIMRKFGSDLYIINRTNGNNVTVVDATTFEVRYQQATGPGSNPQDVALVNDKLYVATFGGTGAVVVTLGGDTITPLNLGNLDPDGEPNCTSAFRVNNDVYISCGLLDAITFQPRGPGKIVVIDTLTDTVRKTITMANKNPLGVFERMPESLGGDLLIPTVPSFGDLTQGCVERITPGPTPVTNGCVVTNAGLGATGGFVARMDFQILGELQILWMIVSNGGFGDAARANLQGFDLGADKLWPLPLSPEAEVLVDLVICPNDMVVVADKTMAANGLRVYDGGSEKTTAPLPIGLIPGSARGMACY